MVGSPISKCKLKAASYAISLYQTKLLQIVLDRVYKWCLFKRKKLLWFILGFTMSPFKRTTKCKLPIVKHNNFSS